jgi:ABC-2 type transport system permease protein
MNKGTGLAELAGRRVVLSRRVDPSALMALFGMTVARLVRGRRLVVLIALFSLPIVFVLLAQRYDARYEPRPIEMVIIFGLIPQTLLPLTPLIFAAGMVQDEIEEQTLTYLLIRPLPRPLIYATKLAGTLFVSATLTVIFTWITFLVVYEFEGSYQPFELLVRRPLKTAAAMVLAQAAYVSLFGLISILGGIGRRTLVAGVIYIAIFEGLLANVDFVIRKITIMYQFRVLTIRGLGLRPADWNIDLKEAPDLTWAALNLAIAAVVMATFGGFLFAGREFRVKTPEGA